VVRIRRVPSAADTLSRVRSIDVFRGITVLVMVFVNDIEDLAGIPAWLRHMPHEETGMTFVDVVFPAFLFIVGTAIPVALASQKDSKKTTRHVIVRGVSLVLIGFLIKYAGETSDARATGIGSALWRVWALASVIVFWGHHPRVSARAAGILRMIAGASLAFLVWRYRAAEPLGVAGWVACSILGLIGGAYVVVSVLVVVLRASPGGLVASLGALVALNVASRSLSFKATRPYFLPLDLAAIVLSGTIVWLLLRAKRTHGAEAGPSSGLARVAVFALVQAALARALAPAYGINKDAATPSWCLYSASICTALFGFLHWWVDLERKARWIGPLEWTGRNALLAYLLPYFVYAMVGERWLASVPGPWVLGAARGLAFSAAICGATALFTRERFALRV
jgi:predicted acyltransferase